MTLLRAEAAVFVPAEKAVALPVDLWETPTNAWHYAQDDSEPISEEDMAELEEVEQWVSLMAELEWMENEHLIASALSYAPAAAQVLEEEALANHRAARRTAKGRAQ